MCSVFITCLRKVVSADVGIFVWHLDRLENIARHNYMYATVQCRDVTASRTAVVTLTLYA